MPQLKAYTDGSDKSGHYILANVGGPHPITLQVTDLAGQILQKAGYGAEDNVPTKVVWSMFDIGILYTSQTINDPPETVGDANDTFQQLGIANTLTTQEQNQLLKYLDEYTGPNQSEIDSLREKLEYSDRTTQGETAMPEDVRDDLDRLSTLHEHGDLTTEEYKLLKSQILNNYSPATESQKTSTKTLNTESWAEEIRFDLAQELWDIIPENKYNNSMKDIHLDNKNTDNINIMYITYHPDKGGFCYTCNFHEQGHEERLFDLLDGDTWEVIIDTSDDSFQPNVMIGRTASQDGFRDELSDRYVEDEIPYLIELIQTIYETDLSNLQLN